MENLFILLTLLSLACFLLSWIIPNTLSPLFKNKLSKGWIRFVLGASVIAFFVLFGITSDSNSVKTENENVVASQTKSETVISQEPVTEDVQIKSQENVKKAESNNFEVEDFAIYDEFFKVKNEQLKRVDQIVNNLTTSRHQIIIKYIAPVNTTEMDALVDVQNKLYAVEEKTNKSNPLHKTMNEALSFYYDSADSCRNWLILLPEDLEFSDNNRFVLADNNLVEKMPKSCGTEERKNGDKKVEELLSLLKQKGYKNNTITAEVAQSKQPVQAKQGPAYKEIFSFSGEGAKNSEPFTITGSKFKIVYDCIRKTTNPLCQAVLRSPSDDVLYKEIFNTIGETQSETVFYEKGTFYIEATVMGGEFDVSVEEYK